MLFQFDKKQVVKILLERNLNVRKLADLAGVSVNSARRAVTGQRLQLLIACKIANVLNIDLF